MPNSINVCYAHDSDSNRSTSTAESIVKRDMDLIRRIVLAIRDHDSCPMLAEVYVTAESIDLGGKQLSSIEWEDIPKAPEQFIYHVRLLLQAGLIQGRDIGTLSEPDDICNITLTWDGQDFADNVANDTVWQDAKSVLGDGDVKTASFGIWAQLIAQQLAANLGLS